MLIYPSDCIKAMMGYLQMSRFFNTQRLYREFEYDNLSAQNWCVIGLTTFKNRHSLLILIFVLMFIFMKYFCIVAFKPLCTSLVRDMKHTWKSQMTIFIMVKYFPPILTNVQIVSYANEIFIDHCTESAYLFNLGFSHLCLFAFHQNNLFHVPNVGVLTLGREQNIHILVMHLMFLKSSSLLLLVLIKI